MSKFQGVRLMVSQKVLDKRKKEVLLLDTISAWEKQVTTFKKL